MKSEHIKDMLKFIDASPTAFHCVENAANVLEKNGYSEFDEKDAWKLSRGRKGYVKRNGSSLIAFSIPNKDPKGFRIYSAHSDSPTFKLKESPEMNPECGFVRLNTEGYGGMIMSSWFDRPLSVAGRIVYDDEGALKEKLVNLDKDLVVIPNVAIHMNPETNKGIDYKPQNDLLPVFSTQEKKTDILSLVSKECGVKAEKILASDLVLYTRQKGTLFGADKEFVLCPRLDDQACVYAGLKGLTLIDTGAEDFEYSNYINVFCIFDNEEVGSGTKQGADSTLLEDTLYRVAESLSLSRTDYLRLLADSFMVSADNAHAAHPAMSSKADPINRPALNKGVVIKFNGSQKYATDAFSAAFLRKMCKEGGIELQNYANNSNVRGGSTLGNISTSHVSIPTVDIGLPQLAMHSACETAGVKDIDELVNLAKIFFEGK